MGRSTFRKVRIAGALASVAIFAGACTSSHGGTGTAQATLKAQDKACGGASTASGTVTYGIAGAGITKLDPNTLAFAGQAPLQTLLYDGLTKYDQNMKVVPDLATSWRSSANLTTWWFNLRKGVRYSNGHPFTAADAVANIERVLNPATHSQARLNIADITSVTPVNNYEVKIQLSAADALLPTALIQVEMSYTEDLAQLNQTGIGTGPYQVKTFVPGESLSLVPNVDYWGPKACLAEIKFVREPDPTSMVTGFKNGELNVIWQVPPADVPAITSDPSASIVTPAGGASGSHVWELDTSSPPFNNPLAREALSYATDREAMVKAAFFGLATVSPANDLVSTKNPAYDHSLTPYTFDLQKAKSLFAQAGVKPGTTFTFWALAGRRPEWITMAEILQQDLAKIGYKLKIERNDVTTWLKLFYPAGKKYPGVIVANYFSLPPNPSLAFKQAQFGKCECNWNDPQFEALAKSAAATPSSHVQGVYNQMQQVFSQSVPVIVVAQQTNIVAISKSVHGVWEDSIGDVHLSRAWLSPNG